MGVRVLIADEDEGLRGLLKRLLVPAVHVIGEAARGEAAAELAKAHRPHVVLMGIDIPGLDAIAATRQIKAADSETKVILLTKHHEEAYLSATGKTGADALLPKRQIRSEILSLVREVMAGFGSIWNGYERRRQGPGRRRANAERRRSGEAEG